MAIPIAIGIIIQWSERYSEGSFIRWVGGAGQQTWRPDPVFQGGSDLPARRLSIRKIKEVLRLRFGLGLTQEQIARSCNIAQATVHRYLERAEAAGLNWPLAAGIDDRQLEERLFPTSPGWEPQTIRPMPDSAAIHQQRKSNVQSADYRRVDGQIEFPRRAALGP
jgi:hypothetical protein